MADTQLSFRDLTVGAEVVGLNPGDEGDPGIQAALYDGWLKYGILLFRNVDNTPLHLGLSRCFGDLEVHPFPEIRVKEDPHLIEIGGGNRPLAYVYDEKELLVGRLQWHRDTAYTPDICKGAMLRMLEIPSAGGETMLADTAPAYDDLPADVKTRLEGLEYEATLRVTPDAQGIRPGVFWKSIRVATREEDPEGPKLDFDYAAATARYPSVIHPAVITHPESGRKCLFLSPTYVDRFIGLTQPESDELLEYLTNHMLKPRYVYTHRWSVNDAILWDNRRFMHAAPGYKPGEPRRALRTTLAGPMRTGRFLHESVQQSDLPVLAD